MRVPNRPASEHPRARTAPAWVVWCAWLAACGDHAPAPEPARGSPTTIRLSVRAAEHRPDTRAFEVRVLGLIFEQVRAATGLTALFLEPPRTIEEQLLRIEKEEADAFVLSPFTYLLARDRYGVEPGLAVQKRGHDSLYVQELVADRSRAIARVEDLRGKRVVLDVEEHSNPVRFWLGYDLLARAGLVARGGTRAEDFALEAILRPDLDRHRSLIEVLEGRADAAFTFHASVDESKHARDGRFFHRDAYPDVMERLVIVALSEGVPYPVLAFRRGFDRDAAQRFANGVIAFLATEEGLHLAFTELRPGSEGLGPVTDADFAGLRRIVSDYEIDLEEVVEHDDDTF